MTEAEEITADERTEKAGVFVKLVKLMENCQKLLLGG